MSLDLTKVAGQVEGMVTRLKASGEERQQRLERALDVLHNSSANLESLRHKIASSKPTWLVADLVDGLEQHYQAPTLPAEFTVIATDGSHIDVDRHRSARCYLLNIGRVVLHYGAQPEASLDSLPHLYAENEELVVKSGENGREQPVEGTLLGIKRSVEECKRLAELATEQGAGSPTLAILDGTLILWGLEAYPEFVSRTLLEEGFLVYLEQMRKMSQARRLALASYISLPRSADVANTLRVALCPQQIVDSDRYCPECKTRDCDAVAGVQDREIFWNLLEPGERSALFITQSSVVEKHYGEHRVYFFYLRVDDEIARVELPQWVAKDDHLLGLAHTLILDQCRRGQGYPVALAEAHEQAVVREADRQNFWQLVETSLLGEHLPSPVSHKSFSKKTRWV